MLRSSVLLLTTRDFINEVFKGHFQGCDFCHGLISKAAMLLFKQSYGNLRSSRREPAASAGTAQSGRCCYRKQSAVCASHNVPSDTIPSFQHFQSESPVNNIFLPEYSIDNTIEFVCCFFTDICASQT